MREKSFEPRLESLRGIAALVVALHHGLMTFNPDPDRNPIFRAIDLSLQIVRPEASVMFFFVLSGYVLGRALERDGRIVPYLIRRAFRILPMFIASIIFAYLCLTLFRLAAPPEGLKEFFKASFWPAPDLGRLWENLTLQSFWINGPSWSIYPEIIGSLFLPVFVLGHQRTPVRWQWPLFIAAFIILAFTPYRLLLWFYCGFFLPQQIARVAGSRWLVLIALFVGGAALVEYAAEYAVYYKFKTIAPSALGASAMIGAVIASDKFLSGLDIRPLRFLGRVSYSFYLLHWPMFYLSAIAYIAAGLPQTGAANLFICIASITMALALSTLTYSAIEVPSMTLGKSIASIFRTRITNGAPTG